MAHSHNHNHAHGHDHGHDHDHTPTITRENERKVLLSFWLIATFMVVEVVGGLLSGSLALLADAGYEFRDCRAPGAPGLAAGAAQQRIALVALGMGA